MSHLVTIYFDYEPNIGVNATCSDWPCRHEFFNHWGEFVAFCEHEYPERYELVEITAENYLRLCKEGVFNV